MAWFCSVLELLHFLCWRFLCVGLCLLVLTCLVLSCLGLVWCLVFTSCVGVSCVLVCVCLSCLVLSCLVLVSSCLNSFVFAVLVSFASLVDLLYFPFYNIYTGIQSFLTYTYSINYSFFSCLALVRSCLVKLVSDAFVVLRLFWFPCSEPTSFVHRACVAGLGLVTAFCALFLATIMATVSLSVTSQGWRNAVAR